MRSYASDINDNFHDIRGMQIELPDIYTSNPDQYGYSQAFSNKLRSGGSNGIVYDSVRHKEGECIAIFRPKVLSPVKQGSHYCYVWNGHDITDVYKKSKYIPIQ